MMGCGESELESVGRGEAPGPPPEPRAPESGAPVPEPGLDLSLSLSPSSESTQRPNRSPGRRKGRAERRGGARKGRQVSWGETWPPARGSAPTSSPPCSLPPAPPAVSGLNVPRSRRLFRDLVSLQVPEEQVLNAALREKLALLPPQGRAPAPKDPPGPGPDMTILCDPETLFYESPHLTLDGLPPLRLQLRPRPSEDTFLMHRTLRRWEA
nr:PREDICTED: protein phosphatase 1 regulatory subunit 35 [Equus przewalskii]